jgi:methylmalonyl-CoA mutase C-terminal domain/subunit
MDRPIRVLVAKVGLDGHDRGAKIVARALRDAGMEVVYTGLHRKPEEVVAAALQEDVDAIGVSLLSGAHMTAFPRLIALMKEQGIWEEVVLLGGGLFPDEDVEALRQMGVAELVGQDATPDQVVAAVRDAVEARRAALRR